MSITRMVPVVFVASVLALPYAAPALCTVVNPTMSMEEMAAHHGANSVDDQGARVRCNFADCATALVAPPVSIAGVFGTSAVTPDDFVVPAQSVVGDPRSPLTPPPQA